MIRSMLTASIRRNKKDAGESLDIRPLDHWQATDIFIAAEPPQLMHIDGDIGGQTPIRIQIIPQAVNIIVPAA
jgi:diacylglycerol kinase family enzyme